MLNLILAAILLTAHVDCNIMEEIRTKYHEVNNSQELEEFIELAESTSCQSAIPYLASAIMRRAEYVGWPMKKWTCFQDGKKMLEKFILENPENIEGRYVRFLAQNEIPAFLGYNEAIEEDLNFLKKNLSTSEIPVNYQQIINRNIAAIQKK